MMVCTIRRIRSAGAGLALFAACAIAPTVAMADYSFTALAGPSGADSGSVQAWGINDLGQIVGTYAVGGVGYSFLYSSGSYQTIGGANFSAIGINDQGTVVGATLYNPTSGYYNGTILNLATNSTSTLNMSGAVDTELRGISNNGIVTGLYANPDGTMHAFYSSSGLFTEIPGTFGTGAGVTLAQGINSAGTIVGSSKSPLGGFLYQIGSGAAQSYTLSGYPVVKPRAINDAGQVAGFAYDSLGNPTSFVASASGIQQLSINGLPPFFIEGMNNQGMVVGYTVDPSTGASLAFEATPTPAPLPTGLPLFATGLLVLFHVSRRQRAS